MISILLFLHSLKLGPQGGKLIVKVLVAAVNMVKAIDFRATFGDEAGKDKGGGSAEVTGHDWRTLHFHATTNACGGILKIEVGTHALHFGNVHEALRENGLGDGADI
jgi:hypothetical protein